MRKAVSAAMVAVVSRQDFLRNVTNEQSKVRGAVYTDEEAYADLHFLGQQAEVLADHLTRYCKDNGLDVLP